MSVEKYALELQQKMIAFQKEEKIVGKCQDNTAIFQYALRNRFPGIVSHGSVIMETVCCRGKCSEYPEGNMIQCHCVVKVNDKRFEPSYEVHQYNDIETYCSPQEMRESNPLFNTEVTSENPLSQRKVYKPEDHDKEWSRFQEYVDLHNEGNIHPLDNKYTSAYRVSLINKIFA